MVVSSNAIAVVGLGCILPDATSPQAFWSNVCRGYSSLRPLSQRTYDWSCYRRDSEAARQAFDEPIGAETGTHQFDWRKFRISPVDAQAINPMHLHVLEAGAQALEEVKRLPHSSSGVFIGGTGLGWPRDSGLRVRLPEFLQIADRASASTGLSEVVRRELLGVVEQSIAQRLRPVSDDGVVNSLASVAAGRLALRFDLRGPHAGIDAGFASGLAAIDTAVQLLRDGTVDLALAGGASERISPLDILAFHRLSVLARKRVRPFDAEADGTLLGEGVALFALKRLEDAVAHGETIYAVVCGIGAASDGRSRSMLAPSADGQSLAMQRAYVDAGFEPSTVSYVECHATGTPVGDASEVRALTRAFGSGSAKGVAIGSAKPFVGHLRGASGAVGFLRAVLTLYHKTIPAQIGFDRPHPNLDIDSTPFFVPVKSIPLEPRAGAPCGRAAVSSFGLGGNNYHAVLESWIPGAHYGSATCLKAKLDPIAIIGLGGVLPDADDVPAFWKSLLDGKDAMREVPSARWSIDRYYDLDPSRLNTTYTRVGCFVEPVPDPGTEFRVPPLARANIDPGQMLVFRAAEEAIRDAKLEAGNWDRSRTAVILGFIGCQGKRLLAEARLNFREFEAELERVLVASGIDLEVIREILEETDRAGCSYLPAISEDTLPGYLGSFNAARIARRFNLQGPHFVVDSACASSLAALHAASRLLNRGVVDTVVIGGVWADGQPEFFVGNCRFSALSASGITPFDERASGFVPGEGAAVLVLRRLADAERDGQHVHALIRSVEGSSDGAAGRSVYSPSAEGEALAMRRCLDAAGVAPEQVDYVECHGTGTALGDLTEIEACTRAYGTGRSRPLLVGSVKSNIGHLMAGAGAVALVKTTLAVREGLIPASIKVQTLNPKIDFASGPVEVVTETKRWKAPEGQPRRAGVSGFGLGGTNFHALLEEFRPSVPRRTTTITGVPGGTLDPRTLPIATAQGNDVADCARALAALSDKLQKDEQGAFLLALAASQQAAGGDAPYRVAIVAADPAGFADRLKLLNAALAKGRDLSYLRTQGVFVGQADASRRVAAIFPGQGPQYPNMLRDACAGFPELVRSLDRMDSAYVSISGKKLRPSFTTDDPDSYLQSDEDIHCAVFAVNVALFQLFESHGAKFDAVMGQSAGELSALVAARSISVEDGLRAVRERTLAVLGIVSADPGRMVTLTCGEERLRSLLRDLPGYAVLAADNAPTACIVSGDKQAICALLKRAAGEGIVANVLPVSHGYHSELIAAARPRYRAALESLSFRRPELEFFSSITGGSLELPVKDYPAHLESQFVEPVRLRQAVTAMHRSGVRLFAECGPKGSLTTFVGEILSGNPSVAQATIHPKVGELEQLHRAFACLFVHRACALSPIRKASMSASNGTGSNLPTTPTRTSAAQHDAETQTDLATVLRAIRDLIDGALRAFENSAAGRPQSRPASNAKSPSVPSRPSRDPIDTFPDAQSSPPLASVVVRCDLPKSKTQADPVGPALASLRHSVQALLVAELVQRTGYPEDMLEPDSDLEAELGIDTVKQVAAMAAVRERYGLLPDSSFRMQDARTIRQAVEYMAARVFGASAQLSTTAVTHGIPLAADAPPSTSPQPDLAQTQTVAQHGSSESKVDAPSVGDIHGASVDIRQRLITELVKRTGYPEDMLELDVDLEAELGIDTVKQVAAMAAVREHYGLSPDLKFRMQDARSIRQAVAYMAGRVAGAGVQSSSISAPAVNASPQVASAARVLTAAEPSLAQNSADAPVISSTAPVASVVRATVLPSGTASPAVAVEISQLLITEFVNRTGYPADMLGLDADLEADLGIDTVKQVAAMAAVRERFGLLPDPNFRMQDARTIRQAVVYLAHRIEPACAVVAPSRVANPSAHSEPTRVEASVSKSSNSEGSYVSNQLGPKQSASEELGPQSDRSSAALDIATVLDDVQGSLRLLAQLVTQSMQGKLPLETPVAVASVEQATAKEAEPSDVVFPERLLELLFAQAGGPQNGRGVEVTKLVVVEAKRASVALPHAEAPREPLRDSGVMPVHAGLDEQHLDFVPHHVLDATYQIFAQSRIILVDNSHPTVPAAVLDTVRQGRAAANASLLREYLDKSRRVVSSPVQWAHSQGFTCTVGSARLSEHDGGSARGMLNLIGCAFDIASIAWFGLTGTMHSLSAIRRISFNRIPEWREELLISARMAQPESGLWCADVDVFDAAGSLYAEISGLEGAPRATAKGLGNSEASDPADRAWRRFAERMGSGAIRAAGGGKS